MCPSAPIPDLLTSVKLLAGPTVEIAAASVGERSLVDVVRQIEEEGKGPDLTVDVDEPEIREETQALVEAPVEALVVDDAAVAESTEENKEETKVSEEDAEEAEALVAEEETAASFTPADGDEEKAMATPPEEPVGEAEPETILVEAQSPEEPVAIEEALPAAEEVTAAAAEAEETAAEAAETVQLEEASAEADAEGLSAAESEPEATGDEGQSCHCAPPADDPAPPAAVEGVLACEETMDSMLESEEQDAPSE